MTHHCIMNDLLRALYLDSPNLPTVSGTSGPTTQHSPTNDQTRVIFSCHPNRPINTVLCLQCVHCLPPSRYQTDVLAGLLVADAGRGLQMLPSLYPPNPEKTISRHHWEEFSGGLCSRLKVLAHTEYDLLPARPASSAFYQPTSSGLVDLCHMSCAHCQETCGS